MRLDPTVPPEAPNEKDLQDLGVSDAVINRIRCEADHTIFAFQQAAAAQNRDFRDLRNHASPEDLKTALRSLRGEEPK